MSPNPGYRAAPTDGKSSSVLTTVNGVDLNTLAYNFSTRSGMHTSAGLRGSNAVTPGKDGSIYRAGKKREEGQLRWRMWASPVTPAGVVPTDKATAYANWRANMDKLLALFDSSIKPLRIVQNGRECDAECVEAIDPEIARGEISAFEVSLVIPDAFWRDTSASTFTSVAGPAATGTQNLTPFLGATAPMADLRFTVTGPITNPKLTDYASGHWVQYTGTLAAGQQWILDAGAFTSKDYGGGNLSLQTTSSGPYAPTLLAITPYANLTTPPSVVLEGTGTGTETQLQVYGRRKYR